MLVGELGVDAHADRARGLLHLDGDPALRSGGLARLGHPGRGLVGIGSASRQAGLLLRGRDERLDRGSDLLRVSEHDLERGSVLRPGPLAPEGEIGLGHDAGDRRPQLVRELGREALLVAQAGGDPVEQVVERGSETRQLVMRRAELEAAVEAAVAPLRRRLGHARDRAQSRREQPAGRDRDDEQEQERERERADQRRAAGLLVRSERDAGHDRPETLPAEDRRHGVEAHVLRVDVEESPPAAHEGPRSRGNLRGSAGSLDGPPAREHPQLRLAESLVRRLAHLQPPPGGRERGKLGRRTGPREVVCIVREAVAENQVEPDCHRCDGERDSAQHGKQQARADSPHPHSRL